MSLTARIAVALALSVTTSSVAFCEPLSASFTALADDESGRSLDVDAAWQPSTWLTLAGGLGSTSSHSAAGDLDGTSLRVSAEAHSERFGARGYCRTWNSNGLDSDTFGARAFFRAEGLTLSVIGEARGLDVDYTLSGSTPQRATTRFSGTGWGAGAVYQWSQWSVVAEGISYQYGSLSRYIPAPSAAPSSTPASTTGSGLPTLPLLPAVPGGASPIGSALPTLTEGVLYRVPALAGSYVTLNQGVFDHLLTAGVERGFARSSLRFDWSGVRDAVLNTDINSFSAGYRYLLTTRWSAGVTLGLTESRYGSVSFGGVSVGMAL